jgi:hypothetical protein
MAASPFSHSRAVVKRNLNKESVTVLGLSECGPEFSTFFSRIA